MSCPRSVTLLLVLAVLARGKSSATVITSIAVTIIVTVTGRFRVHTRLDARNVRASSCSRDALLFFLSASAAAPPRAERFLLPRQVATPPSAREAFTAEAPYVKVHVRNS